MAMVAGSFFSYTGTFGTGSAPKVPNTANAMAANDADVVGALLAAISSAAE